MSRYRGPRFKRIWRLGTLPGLTSKRPRAESNLRNQPYSCKKISITYSLRRKTKIAFPLWSYRTTIA